MELTLAQQKAIALAKARARAAAAVGQNAGPERPALAPPAAAPAPPAPGPLDFVSQGMSGVNEGIANTLGFPVQAATWAINGIDNLTGNHLPEIDHPFGGQEMFRQLMSPTIKPESDNPALQMTRRVGQEIGATVVPGLGFASRAARPFQTLGKDLLASVGSGTGAAVAQQAFPGNGAAELAAQVLGGLTPGGIGRALGRKATGPAMSVEALRDAKNEAYKAADNLGAAYSPSAYDRLVAGMVTAAKNDHISPDRHAAAYSLLQDLASRRGKPFSLTELDQIRQEIRRDLITPSYGNPVKAADAHFGELMLDELDNFIAGAKPSDMVGGSASDAANAIIKARSLNTRYRKAETLADALVKAQRQAAASGSGGNINNALRQQIKSILNSPKKSKAFTEQERAAMEGLIKQGKLEELLRWVGKFSPGGNGLIGLIEIGATVHNPALAALPVAGMVAKGVADRGTLNKLTQLQNKVSGAPALAVPRAPLFTPALTIGQAANAASR